MASSNETFLRAIEETSVDEIPTAIEPTALASLRAAVSRTGLVMLGEMHGVRENPAIIYTLMRQLDCRGLALEWNRSLNRTVDLFLGTGRLDFASVAASGDGYSGRISAAHFALLRRLEEESRLDSLILFDEVPTTNWNRREERMANTILRQRSPLVPTLVAAGSTHTGVQPLRMGVGADPRHPMGEHICAAVPNTPSSAIKYLSGRYYNYGVKRFPSSHHRQAEARLYQSAPGSYIYELAEAHAAVVPEPGIVVDILGMMGTLFSHRR